MKTYKELTIAEAVGLSLNATACNPVRFAFKDRGESTVWTEAKLLGVNLRSAFPFSSSLGCGTELCAQIVEEKPDPVASGYNPKGLKESEVGVSEGWRLLTKEEHEPKRWVPETSYCCSFSSCWSIISDWLTFDGTLRTKKPNGFYLPKPDVFNPWTLETAPKLGVLFRVKNSTGVHQGASWTENNVYFGCGQPAFMYNYQSLLNSCEHSLDGGKTWSACGSKEVAK